MKKIGVWLFAFILLVSVVKAEININSFESAEYNLGEKVTLAGSVVESNDFIGNLIFNSVCNNVSKQVYFSLVDISANNPYNFNQQFPVKSYMVGNCYFEINLESEDGNVSETKSSDEYKVTTELRIETELNVLSQQPGKDIIVNGVIRSSKGIRVGGGSVVLTLNEKIYSSGLSDGAFSYNLNLPSDIDSGAHSIDLQARDLQGNEGKGNISFKVLSVAKGLTIELDKDTYRPLDDVLIKIILSDQSGKNIEGSSTVQLYDPNLDKEFTKVVENGQEISIPLSSIILPGTWTLEAETKDFKISKKFFVDEVRSREISFDNEILTILNSGNVDYEDPIEVDLKNEEGEAYRVIKKVSLKPNQTISINLNNEVPGGNYDLSVGGSSLTGNVVIEGSALGTIKGNKTLGYIALSFVFVFLIVIVVSKGRRKASKREAARTKGREILHKKFDRPVVRKEDAVVSKQQRADIDFLVNRVKQENPIGKQKEESKRNPFDIFN